MKAASQVFRKAALDRLGSPEQLDELIGRYDDMCARSRHDDLSDLKEESRVLAVQFQAAIDRMTTSQSTYRLDADRLRSEPIHVRVVQLSGVAL